MANRKYDPYGYVPRAQELASQGVEGFGEQLRPGLEREIGNALGGLNSIGALRSGGTTVALSDITTNYAQQVGAYAKQAAGEAIGYGLKARQIRDAWSEQQRARKGGLLKAIGAFLGAGVGFVAGGPAGAAVGMQAGTAATGPEGTNWGGDAEQNSEYYRNGRYRGPG